MEMALRRTYAACPKLVIAADACDGGAFGVFCASRGAVANVIPIDIRISGCPPPDNPRTYKAKCPFQEQGFSLWPI
jgi:Ni,Fe-hydrogenase III small subunit